jgi:hypothetical protein
MNRKTKIEQVGGGSNSVPFPLPDGVTLNSNLAWSSTTESPLQGKDVVEAPYLVIPLVLVSEGLVLAVIWNALRGLGGVAAAVFGFIMSPDQLEQIQQMSQPCES